MRKCIISASAAFLLVASEVQAQESSNTETDQDAFEEAIHSHVETKVKTKIRQDITEKILERIGNQKLDDFVRKIPGAVAKNSLIGKLFDVAKLAFTIRPAGEGSDIVGLDQNKTLDIKPADTDDVGDIVRWVFEVNDCVATESDIFGALTDAGYGMMLANNTVVWVSNQSFTEVINEDPYTYRYSGSELCSG